MTVTYEPGRPNAKQIKFLSDSEHKYIAFGGARGGGKSWAVRVKAALLCLKYSGIRVMIIRRSYPELRENHIVMMLRELPRELVRYNDGRKELVFVPTGSTILFRYCAGETDIPNFQGMEVDVLFIDEATQLSEDVFRALMACVRGVNDLPKRVYITCNPGGPGHGWVKRLFIDRAYKTGEKPEEYTFVQSLVQDNRALMDAQPEYIAQLEALPAKRREAWLYGKWDVFEGQFFEEFTDDPAHYEDGLYTHVIDPFDPPATWRRYRSFDFGYARPFSCGWWAVSPEGVIYRILELYGCTDTANEGVKWDKDKIFDEIARVEREHPYLRGFSIEGVADPSIWDASRGESIADTAARHGIYFAPGDNKRIPGWMQVHYRMAFDSNGQPLIQVFRGCRAFIRTIPLLLYDEHRVEDCDTSQEDHVADEVRYMCMTRPVTPRIKDARPAREYDPLDIGGEERPERLKIYEI